MKTLTTLGEKIKLLIEGSNDTKKDIAHRLGMSRNGLTYAIEKNSFQFELVLKIANLFNLPITYFLPDDYKHINKKNYTIGDNSQIINGNVSESEIAYNKKESEVEILKNKVNHLQEKNKLLSDSLEKTNRRETQLFQEKEELRQEIKQLKNQLKNQ